MGSRLGDEARGFPSRRSVVSGFKIKDQDTPRASLQLVPAFG